MLMKDKMSSKNHKLLIAKTFEEDSRAGVVRPHIGSWSNESKKENDFYLIDDHNPTVKGIRVKAKGISKSLCAKNVRKVYPESRWWG